MTIRHRLRAATAASVSVLGLAAALTVLSPATAAHAAPNCQPWSDPNTFGTYCSSADGNPSFRAMAKCKNGKTVPGQWKRVGGGVWSYAYCTSVNSSLSYGWAEIGR
ncbi:hypothetical protein [Streptomyces sp. NPDC004629]|uniref:hypothetical protein n=1 Tax=Streptomyces sp. NPDC004629 TaxID=3364705 RepID=UPI0036C590E9